MSISQQTRAVEVFGDLLYRGVTDKIVEITMPKEDRMDPQYSATRIVRWCPQRV